MNNENFIYKTSCEISILSDVISPDDITEQLGITPVRSFKKGEQTVSKHSGSIITKPHNLWAFESGPTFLEMESISHHVEYLKSVFLPKERTLKRYKDDPRLEVCIWVWIETNNAGIGLDLEEADLLFLNSVSNRVHFSIVLNKEINS